MNHPTHEELITFLYGEVSTDQKIALQSHLKACGSCRQQMAEWKETGCTLNEWHRVSVGAHGRAPFVTALKYAAAAALVLGLGFLGGRFSTAQDLRTLHAQMRELADQSKTQAKAEAAEQLRAFAEKIEARVKTTQIQTAADYTSLRKELETVAVLTQASLQQAQQQIVQLAGNSPNTKP
jgi:anti-sigma factor RsiW